MLDKIRQKLLSFINSDKDVPLLAGFSTGFYMLCFYYSKNFSLAFSLPQLLFFTGYYIVIPSITLFGFYRIMAVGEFKVYRRNMLFTGMAGFIGFFMLQLINTGYYQPLAIVGITAIAAVLSVRLKKFYKLFIILLFLTSLLNLKPLAKVCLIALSSSKEWKKQPDAIESIVFKTTPNIYYIQPDGYTNPNNLKSTTYNFDNSDFDSFLSRTGFTAYNGYHSNYYSTLLSNSSMFSMKHHYLQEDINLYAARGIIVGDNPVLRILKKNNYKTFFLTEKPYLVMNRPVQGYDYCNIDYAKLPYLKDGLDMDFDVFSTLKSKMKENSHKGNFYFIEHFSPGHINISPQDSGGINEERKIYLAAVVKTNVWLKNVLNHIVANDPGAIIIIGADHGGYVGFEYTAQSSEKTDKPELVKSVFGAHLSIKWNNVGFTEYDKGLKSSVNLFRTVFAFMAQDKKYLNHLQDNSSYIRLSRPDGYYKYIDDGGNVVFEKMENVQD